MKLFYAQTPNARKACAVVKHLGLEEQYSRVNLGEQEQRTPDYLAMNPNGKVPMLSDGDTYVWESNAIMFYLARRTGSEIWPRDDREVEIIKWLSWDIAHFSRHSGTLFFQNFIKPTLGLGQPDPEQVAEAIEFLRRFAGVLDTHLRDREFIVGDTLTVADFAVASTLPDADKSKLPLDDFTAVSRWHASLCEIPAWRNPFPDDVASAA